MSTRVTTGKNTIWSYVNVVTPKSINGEKAKYSMSVIVPKEDTVTIEKIKAATRAAYEEGMDKLKGSAKFAPALEALKTPMRDGDLERPGDPAYKNAFFFNANSNTRPRAVDRDKNDILDPEEIYSGCKGPVSVNFFAYNNSGNRGIACGLRGLMKWSDGERLGGGGDVLADFDEIL